MIGQAQGILMERLRIDSDQAFAYLRRTSHAENRKLIIICNEIVETHACHRTRRKRSQTTSNPKQESCRL